MILCTLKIKLPVVAFGINRLCKIETRIKFHLNNKVTVVLTLRETPLTSPMGLKEPIITKNPYYFIHSISLCKDVCPSLHDFQDLISLLLAENSTQVF